MAQRTTSAIECRWSLRIPRSAMRFDGLTLTPSIRVSFAFLRWFFEKLDCPHFLPSRSTPMSRTIPLDTLRA